MNQTINKVQTAVVMAGRKIRRRGAVRPLISAAIIFAFMQFASIVGQASMADGDRAMKSGKYRAAIRYYETYLKENPKDDEAMIKAAQAYEGAKWWGGAVQWWDRYLDMFPGSPQADIAAKHSADCHRWLGSNYYITGGSHRLAIEELDKAIAIDPKLADAYVWLGIIYQNEGMFDETIIVLDRGLTALPEDEDLLRMRKDARNYRDNGGNAYITHREGIALYESGDKDGALNMFRAAAEASPDFAAAHLWIARILFELGHYAASIPEWQAAIRIQPDNEHAMFYLLLAQRDVANGK